MVEVFKTNVQEVAESQMIIGRLLERFPDKRINFDLSDCDRILRVEGEHVCIESVSQLVVAAGYFCEVLL
ncbi:hypothetical protein GWC95_14935 [Sediminibacterium roseum]|uniref:Uncharacterized protein n=1 Tax=Sediminibacterium roseum TaxID=1978412 RepID=A0ABW9ZVP9_9BACT|nr:hypothetical protein [Sediminibacterium roseum]NCI51226.1 hypothetical protein [Sediminibacterium roseum]